MKVYIVSSVPIPNGMASTKRVKCLARALKDSKVDVEVITYIRTEPYGKKTKNTVGSGMFDDVSYKYIGGKPMRSSLFLLRRFYDYCDRRALFVYLKKTLKRGDVVYMYDGNCWEFSVKLANLVHYYGAFYAKDLCELPYGDGIETEERRRNREMAYAYEFPCIDALTPISDGLYNIAKKYTRKDCAFLKVPILVDYYEYEMNDKSSEAEYPFIFHSGTLTEQKDGILGIIKAFGEIHKQDEESTLRFYSTGYAERSIHSKEIHDLIETYKIQKYVRFLGYLTEIELKDYLSKAMLVIINKYENMQNHYCFSTKLGEYLAASKPVIITDYGEAKNWVVDGVSAYVVPAGNVDALENAIRRVMENPIEARKVAEQGRLTCKESFNYHHWGEPIKNLFEKL